MRTPIRSLSAVLLAGVLIGALAAQAPAGRRPQRRPAAAPAQRGPLTFSKPVALESASPARTAMSIYYGQSDHEWSGEPVIQVAPDGKIIIAGTCCLVASSPVWYSDDGKKFQEVETPAHAREWSIGAEGDLAIDADGRVYFVDTYLPGMMLTRWSPDSEGNLAWDYSVPANVGIPVGVNDRPWLAMGKDALYLYINHVTHVAVYRSTDGGLSWTGGNPLSWEGSLLAQEFFPGHVAAHRKSDTVYVSGVVGSGGILGSAVSRDGAASFENSIIRAVDPEETTFSPIFTGATAIDESGTAYVTWSETDAIGADVKVRGCDVLYAYSRDRGKSWSEPIEVSDSKGCATFPWIAAGAKGKVALAWYQTPTEFPAGQGPRSIQDGMPPDAHWFVHAAAVTEASSSKPRVAEARVPTKTPIASGPLQRQLWDFLQVAIGPEGGIHITYADKFEDTAPQTWYVGSDRAPNLR